MKVLHIEFENCNPCPYVALVGGKPNEGGEHTTIVACKNKRATTGTRKNARVVLEQPMSYVLAEVNIPDWCPLPDKGR